MICLGLTFRLGEAGVLDGLEVGGTVGAVAFEFGDDQFAVGVEREDVETVPCVLEHGVFRGDDKEVFLKEGGFPYNPFLQVVTFEDVQVGVCFCGEGCDVAAGFIDGKQHVSPLKPLNMCMRGQQFYTLL